MQLLAMAMCRPPPCGCAAGGPGDPDLSADAMDKNPMFLEKRVYQGSSGKVYPLLFTDRIAEKPWTGNGR